MTISIRTATGLTAAADTATPFAYLGYTLPTGHATDDLLIAIYGGKPYDTTAGTPTDYTAAGSVTSGANTANGNGVGSTRVQAFYKVHDGSESNPASTPSAGYSPGMTAMLACYSSVGGSGWTVTNTTGQDSTVTGTSISAAGGSLTWAVGDLVVVISAGCDNLDTETSAALSIAGGVTHGGLTEQLATNTTTTGNDGSLYVYTATITGAGTGAPTFTATGGVSGASDRGVVFLKITEPSSVSGSATVDTPAFSLSGLRPATAVSAQSSLEGPPSAAQARVITPEYVGSSTSGSVSAEPAFGRGGVFEAVAAASTAGEVTAEPAFSGAGLHRPATVSAEESLSGPPAAARGAVFEATASAEQSTPGQADAVPAFSAGSVPAVELSAGVATEATAAFSTSSVPAVSAGGGAGAQLEHASVTGSALPATVGAGVTVDAVSAGASAYTATAQATSGAAATAEPGWALAAGQPAPDVQGSVSAAVTVEPAVAQGCVLELTADGQSWAGAMAEPAYALGRASDAVVTGSVAASVQAEPAVAGAVVITPVVGSSFAVEVPACPAFAMGSGLPATAQGYLAASVQAEPGFGLAIAQPVEVTATRVADVAVEPGFARGSAPPHVVTGSITGAVTAEPALGMGRLFVHQASSSGQVSATPAGVRASLHPEARVGVSASVTAVPAVAHSRVRAVGITADATLEGPVVIGSVLVPDDVIPYGGTAQNLQVTPAFGQVRGASASLTAEMTLSGPPAAGQDARISDHTASTQASTPGSVDATPAMGHGRVIPPTVVGTLTEGTAEGPPVFARAMVPEHSASATPLESAGAEGPPIFARATVLPAEASAVPLESAEAQGPPAFARGVIPPHALGTNQQQGIANANPAYAQVRDGEEAIASGATVVQGAEIISAYAYIPVHATRLGAVGSLTLTGTAVAMTPTSAELTRPPTTVVSAGAWVNAQNAYADDGSVASTANTSRNVTYSLDLGGFDFSSLPVGARIMSVQVTTQAWKTAAAMEVTEHVQLFDGATPIGTEQALSLLATSDGVTRTTSWSPTLAQLQSPTFMVRYGSTRTGTSTGSTALDYVSVRVFYELPVQVSASGSLELNASVAWTVPGITGSLSLAATADASARAFAQGAIALGGEAMGSPPPGTAGGSLFLTGTVTASVPVAASGSLALSGQVAASARPTGATGSLLLTSAATAVSNQPLWAAMSLVLRATVAAQARPAAVGSLSLTGTVTQARARTTAVGALALRMICSTASAGWYEFVGNSLHPLTMAGEWNGSGYTPLTILEW